MKEVFLALLSVVLDSKTLILYDMCNTPNDKGHSFYKGLKFIILMALKEVLKRLLSSSHSSWWKVLLSLYLSSSTGEEIVQGTKSFLVLLSTTIQFLVSVQHNCCRGECQPIVAGKEMQEWETTTRNKHLIKHTDNDHFTVNMGALHNFTKLCHVLPPELTMLSLLFPEREEFHKSVVQKARTGRCPHRKKTAVKHRMNAAAKKKEAEEAEKAAHKAEEAAREGRDLKEASDASDTEEGPEPQQESDTENNDADE